MSRRKIRLPLPERRNRSVGPGTFKFQFHKWKAYQDKDALEERKFSQLIRREEKE